MSDIHLSPAPNLARQRRDALDLDSDVAEPELQIAQVKVVVPMSDEERRRLQTYLERVAGRSVDLRVRIDRSILGGVWVRMDDLVLDGSVRARLDALHERLCVNCRIPEGAGPSPHRTQE